MEIYFRSLLPEEIGEIARGAAHKMEIPITETAVDVAKRYATNGREAVNIIQLAAGVAQAENSLRSMRLPSSGLLTPDSILLGPDRRVPTEAEIGVVNGLAIYGPNMGMLLELEVTAQPVSPGTGELLVTGIVEEEEQGSSNKKIRRKSMARSSVENVLTVIRRQLGIDVRNYNIHVNFPGGVPMDGPSAGIAIATAIVSAIRKQRVDNFLAMTGELSIRGSVKPVGGIAAKIEAAHQAGCRRVFIPKENWQERFKHFAEGFQVIPVESLSEVLKSALIVEQGSNMPEIQPALDDILARLEINSVPVVNLPERGQTC